MTPLPRLWVLDASRTAALVCMVWFHFNFDLMLFGHLPPGVMFTGYWPYFARGIAGSFLFLAGVSLWLAHSGGVRWPAFWRRFGIVAGAAALVSGVTYFSFGGGYVRFGILHAIAASSLIGLAFLRLPAALTLVIALGVFLAPMGLRSDLFAAPWLLWLGLAPEVPPMMDYEPLLPWAAPFLAGIALADLADRAGLWQSLSRWRMTGRMGRALAWPGQHSLAVYLIHQPVLFGLVWLYTYLGL
jgi:uncharacterized membrane protein